MSDKPTLIPCRSVSARTSLSRATIYRKLAEDPEFPKPVPMGGRRVAWVEAEVDSYVAKRIAARDAA